MKNHYKTRIVALILLAAGYGWAGGHYIPTNSPVVAYLFQLVVIGFLLVAGSAFLAPAVVTPAQTRRWPVTALSIFSVISLVVNIANIVRGALNTDPHGFGSHNSFADLVPIAIIIAGSLVWISTIPRPGAAGK
jgi:hypothetical protein